MDPAKQPIVHFEDVTKRFQAGTDETTALRELDLAINRGEIFGIIGESGAGKSTLLQLINGLLKPTSGSLTVAGRQVRSEEHTSELQSRGQLVCRLLLERKKERIEVRG